MNWLFRNRQTGRITVAQRPNATLSIWIVTEVIGLVFDPSGWFGSALRLAGRAALLIWAVTELAQGVNPFRRILGAIVLAWLAVGLASR